MPGIDTVDFGARYRVAGYNGVAFYLRGYATDMQEIETWFCDHTDSPVHGYDCEVAYDYETVERTDMVRAVMVGDDREHLIDVDDLTPIDEDDYCGSCGQIGCTADGR